MPQFLRRLQSEDYFKSSECWVTSSQPLKLQMALLRLWHQSRCERGFQGWYCRSAAVIHSGCSAGSGRGVGRRKEAKWRIVHILPGCSRRRTVCLEGVRMCSLCNNENVSFHVMFEDCKLLSCTGPSFHCLFQVNSLKQVVNHECLETNNEKLQILCMREQWGFENCLFRSNH